MIKIIATDANRYISSHPNERNDCFIRAICIAYKQSYDHIYGLFKLLTKFKKNEGVNDYGIAKVIKLFDPEVIWFMPEVGKQQISVERFIHEFPKGTYLLTTEDHITVLINGTLYDIDMAPKHLLSSDIVTVFKKSST